MYMSASELESLLLSYPECGMAAYTNLSEGDAEVVSNNDNISEEDIEALIEITDQTFSVLNVQSDLMVAMSGGILHISVRCHKRKPEYLLAICDPSVDVDSLTEKMKQLVKTRNG